MTGVQKDEAAAFLRAFAEPLAPFPSDDAVESPVNEGDGQLPAANDRGDPGKARFKMAHGSPPQVELLPHFAVIDMMDRKFVHARIDEVQRMAAPQKKKEQARPLHGPAEKQVAERGGGSVLIPRINFHAVGSGEDKPVKAVRIIVQKIEGDTATHTVAEQAPRPLRPGAGKSVGDRLHDLKQLLRLQLEALVPFRPAMEGQVDGYDRQVRGGARP